jgi:hypothetical protein
MKSRLAFAALALVLAAAAGSAAPLTVDSLPPANRTARFDVVLD